MTLSGNQHPRSPEDPSRTLHWSGGSAELHRQSGMVGPVEFFPKAGSVIRPFHTAPWTTALPASASLSEKDPIQELPGIMRKLRGDWFCAPFGIENPALPPSPPAEENTPVGYEALLPDPIYPHGYSSNALWDWDDETEEENALHLRLRYPEESPVREISRRISGEGLTISFLNRLEVKRNCCFPLGIHPTFSLEASPRQIELVPPPFLQGFTAPLSPEPSSLIRAEETFTALRAIPGNTGEILDLSRLPLPGKNEELLQITGLSEGRFTLINHEQKHRIILEWDLDAFPSCLLWISNRGRPYAPWNSRNLCLGIEPVKSAFDLGTTYALSSNPVNRTGTPTFEIFTPGQVRESRHSVRVEEIN